MGKYNLELGNLGEKIAKKYLENKGYKIIEQNCRNKYGEIDLICRDRDCLIFIEVKTRSKEQFGTPEDALNKNKIQRLIKNSEAYMLRKGYRVNYRIDAICIVLDKDKRPKRIDHYENIN